MKFSESVAPVVSYTTRGNEKRFTLAQRGGIHWRGTCKPVDVENTTFVCRQTAREDSYQVTVLADTADLSGNRLGEAVVSPVLEVKPQERVVAETMVEPTGQGTAQIPTHRAPQPVQGADDFVGAVYIPDPKHNDLLRTGALPVPDATVIIMSGSRSGERVTTSQSGQYIFQGVAENSLHLRVEKSDLEPKEVIVHRTRATTLADGTALRYTDDPQHIAGNILVGHRIPDAARSILSRISVVDDLLYINSGSYRRHNAFGFYQHGVAVVAEGDLFTIAHEFFHAHQDTWAPDNAWDWLETPEGRAYMQAREKDLNEFGISSADRRGEIHFETAADVFAWYWSGTGDIKQKAPYRYAWAEEWFGR